MQARSEVNRQSDILLTEGARDKALLLGFGEDNPEIITHLKEALWLSVKTKHPNGNMRYKDWIFLVNHNQLINIHLVKCSNCDDTKRITVYEECITCEGKGCKRCRKSGELKSSIPCPDCAARR